MCLTGVNQTTTVKKVTIVNCLFENLNRLYATNFREKKKMGFNRPLSKLLLLQFHAQAIVRLTDKVEMELTKKKRKHPFPSFVTAHFHKPVGRCHIVDSQKHFGKMCFIKSCRKQIYKFYRTFFQSSPSEPCVAVAQVKDERFHNQRKKEVIPRRLELCSKSLIIVSGPREDERHLVKCTNNVRRAPSLFSNSSTAAETREVQIIKNKKKNKKHLQCVLHTSLANLPCTGLCTLLPVNKEKKKKKLRCHFNLWHRICNYCKKKKFPMQLFFVNRNFSWFINAKFCDKFAPPPPPPSIRIRMEKPK